MTERSQPLRAKCVGYTRRTENFGDEALFQIIRGLLAPEIEVSDDCAEPDLALLGGGTLINQSPWLIDAFEAALDQAGRGVALGTGVGDLAFWGDHFDRWTPLLRRCGFVGVRGPDSLALLREHGIDHAVCVGDPYLSIEVPETHGHIPQRLGVNLGSTNDSLWGTDDRDLLDVVTDALITLKRQGWSVIWVSVWSKDLELLEGVRQRVDPESEPVIDARTQTQEAISAIASCELFLGEKLHANAMAAVAGVPFVSLEYQPKVRDFAASLNLAQWTISTAERDTKRILDLIESLGAQRGDARAGMVAAREALRRQLRDFVGAIKIRFAAQHTP